MMTPKERGDRIYYGSAGLALLLIAPALVGLALIGDEGLPRGLYALALAATVVIAIVCTLAGAWAVAGAFLGTWRPRR